MPNLITIDQYKETIKIIQGRAALNPVFDGLKKWYMENANFEIYNFFIEKDRYSRRGTNGYRIMYLSNGILNFEGGEFVSTTIVEYKNDESETMDRLNGEAFNYFVSLCQKHNMYADIVWAYDSVSGYDFNPIWRCETISNFARKTIPIVRARFCNANIEKMINSGFGTITVFFDTDNHLMKNKENGTCTNIENAFNTLLKTKRIDKRLKKIYKDKSFVEFSSTETLERDYSGNLYYFYK